MQSSPTSTLPESPIIMIGGKFYAEYLPQDSNSPYWSRVAEELSLPMSELSSWQKLYELKVVHVRNPLLAIKSRKRSVAAAEIEDDTNSDRKFIALDESDHASSIPKMHITVKPLRGRSIDLDVEPSDTVIQIKRKIASKQGMVPPLPRLLLYGIELKDDCTLGHYGIKNDGSTTHLFQKESYEMAQAAAATAGLYHIEWEEDDEEIGTLSLRILKPNEINDDEDEDEDDIGYDEDDEDDDDDDEEDDEEEEENREEHGVNDDDDGIAVPYGVENVDLVSSPN